MRGKRRGDKKVIEIASTCRTFGEGNLEWHCFQVARVWVAEFDDAPLSLFAATRFCRQRSGGRRAAREAYQKAADTAPPTAEREGAP